jgi:hypothetical protein
MQQRREPLGSSGQESVRSERAADTDVRKSRGSDKGATEHRLDVQRLGRQDQGPREDEGAPGRRGQDQGPREDEGAPGRQDQGPREDGGGGASGDASGTEPLLPLLPKPVGVAAKVWIEEVTEDTNWWIALPLSPIDDAGLGEGAGLDGEQSVAGRAGPDEAAPFHPFDELEIKLIDALEAPLETYCTCCPIAAQRAEVVRAIFSALTESQARSLRARFAAADPRDEIALAFRRIPMAYQLPLRGLLEFQARRLAYAARPAHRAQGPAATTEAVGAPAQPDGGCATRPGATGGHPGGHL